MFKQLSIYKKREHFQKTFPFIFFTLLVMLLTLKLIFTNLNKVPCRLRAYFYIFIIIHEHTRHIIYYKEQEHSKFFLKSFFLVKTTCQIHFVIFITMSTYITCTNDFGIVYCLLTVNFHFELCIVNKLCSLRSENRAYHFVIQNQRENQCNNNITSFPLSTSNLEMGFCSNSICFTYIWWYTTNHQQLHNKHLFYVI